MKKLLALIIILALIGAGVFYWKSAQRAANEVFYTTAKAETGTVESVVTATGTLAAVTAINVGSEVSGTIQKIFVEHNSQVKKGQILAQINPQTVQTQVDRAKASLQKSQSSFETSKAQADASRASLKKAQSDAESSAAKLRQARAAVNTAKAALDNASANTRKARAERDNAKLNYERQENLFQQDLIAQNERDNAYTSYKTAQAALEGSEASERSARSSYESSKISLEGAESDYNGARIQIESATDQLKAAEASVAGAQADVEQAQASLESSEVDLGKTTIRSPIDGIVLSILVSEGQTVQASFQAPELFVLAQNLNEMQVETTVDEADIGQIKQGASATFTVDAWPDETFTGTVAEVRKSASTTNNVVTYPVIVHTSNANLHLMPGMTATVTISVDKHENVLLIPNTALRFKPEEKSKIDGEVPKSDDPKAKTVYTLKKGARGVITPHTAIPVMSDGTNTEITDTDIQEGDLIVTGTTDPPKKMTGRRRRGPGPF